jgi:GxxExxY protein
MNADNAALDRLSERIIGCAFTVSNTLGVGFLERVYGNALSHELSKAGLKAKQQYGITVRYDGIVVGEYVADFLVEDAIVVELKVTT